MTVARVESSRFRSGLSLLQAGLHQAATLTLRSAVTAAVDSAKHSTRFKDASGATRASIHGEVFGQRGFVTAGGSARFLENGTRPHLIVASGRAIRFVVNGTAIFRKWVKHPGTKPRPFMAEARERGIMAAEYGAEVFVGAAIRNAR